MHGWCRCRLFLRFALNGVEFFQDVLWEFKVGGRTYGLPMDEDWSTAPRIDAYWVRLRDVLSPGKTVIDYLYDFGDAWEHRLTVTGVRQG